MPVDAYMVLYDIQAILNGIVLWANGLPTWGMVVFTLISSSLVSKLGLAADIAFVVLFWNVFGAAWGVLALALSAVTIGFFILLSIFLE